MEPRTVYVSPYVNGVLNGANDARIEIAKRLAFQPFNSSALWSATLLQAGAANVLVADLKKRTSLPPFFKTRIRILSQKSLHKFYAPVSAVLHDQARPNVTGDDLVVMIDTLASLLVAAHYRCALAWEPQVTVDSFRDLVRPEFYAAIETLYSNLEYAPTATPIPRGEIVTAHVKRFAALLDGDLFRAYGDAHAHLSIPTTPLATSLGTVRNTAHALTGGFLDSLTLQNIVLASLTFAHKTIDVFLGALPAATLALLRPILETYLKRDEQRIVLYDLMSQTDAAYNQFLDDCLREHRAKHPEVDIAESLRDMKY